MNKELNKSLKLEENELADIEAESENDDHATELEPEEESTEEDYMEKVVIRTPQGEIIELHSASESIWNLINYIPTLLHEIRNGNSNKKNPEYEG